MRTNFAIHESKTLRVQQIELRKFYTPDTKGKFERNNN